MEQVGLYLIIKLSIRWNNISAAGTCKKFSEQGIEKVAKRRKVVKKSEIFMNNINKILNLV